MFSKLCILRNGTAMASMLVGLLGPIATAFLNGGQLVEAPTTVVVVVLVCRVRTGCVVWV